MTTYNTGNPLGSTDARDLYDNAENLDNLVNGAALAYSDRRGVSRKSWAGIESDFQDFLSSSGYEFLGDYDAGIVITSFNQVVRESGEFWRLGAGATLPYTTTGTWATDDDDFVSVGDATLRQDLGHALHKAVFDTLEDFRASSTDAGTVEILAANAGTTTGRMILRATGTSGGTPTLTAARFTALAAGEIINAGGFGYALIGDFVSPYQLGAVGDGVAEDQTAVQLAINLSLIMQVPVYAQAGTYLIGTVDSTYDVRINFTTNGQSFRLYGDGAQTIFKEKDGKNASVGKFTRMFFVYLQAASLDIQDIVFESFTIDKNGRSNGTPPTLFEWEQSHAISVVDSDGSSTIQNIVVKNVTVNDRTGAGIYVGGQVTVAKSVLLENCSDGDTFQQGIIGKRGMFEINPNCENVVFDACCADFMQIELVTADAKTSAKRLITKVNNSRIDNIEYTSSQITGRDYTWLIINNSTVKEKLLLGSTSGMVSNSEIQIPENIYPASLLIENSTILFDTADGTAIEPIYCRDYLAFTKVVSFSNCHFKINYEGSVTATNPVFFSGATTTSPENFRVIIENCTFDPRFYTIVDAYRSNYYKVSNCDLSCAGYAFRVGGATTFAGKLDLVNNNYKNVVGAAVMVVNSNSLWSLSMKENGLASDIYFDASSTSLSTVNASLVTVTPTLYSGAAPTNGQVTGTVVHNNAPAVGSAKGWLCTVSGVSPTFVSTGNL